MYTTIISPETLLSQIDQSGQRIIDCRFYLAQPDAGRQAYLESHIPGAIYAHLDDELSGKIIPGKTGRHPLPDIQQLSRLFSFWGIDESTQVIIYDQGHSGIAARLWWMLHWLGHPIAAVLDGGWEGWLNTEGPCTDKIATITPSTFIAKLQAGWVVEADDLLAKDAFLLMDARAASRFKGLEEPIDPVAGHIPGAVSMPFLENLTALGRWRKPDELARRFAQGQASERPVVCYCGSGVTACNNLLAMYYAGLGMKKLYPGSWSHWITDKDRPISTN